MKKTTKIQSVILASVMLFLLGLFINWFTDRSVLGSQEEMSSIISVSEQETKIESVSNDSNTLETNMNIAADYSTDPIAEEKRGALLTDEISNQLVLTHSQTINGVTLQVSDVYLHDHRAYVNVCIQSETSFERMDFGQTDLYANDENWHNAYINYQPEQIADLGTCMVFEYYNVFNFDANEALFEMLYTAYALPDEGLACEIYGRRLETDKTLNNMGVAVECSEQTGLVDFQITRNDKNLNENYVYDEVHKVVNGITEGPWRFDLKVFKIEE